MTIAGQDLAQVFESSSQGGSRSMELMYLLSFACAQKNIRLATPYFVPDEPFLHAIRAASLRGGIEVHLVLSMHANQLITQFAQRSYYDDLLAAADLAIDRIKHQINRYKEKIQDHRRDPSHRENGERTTVSGEPGAFATGVSLRCTPPPVANQYFQLPFMPQLH